VTGLEMTSSKVYEIVGLVCAYEVNILTFKIKLLAIDWQIIDDNLKSRPNIDSYLSAHRIAQEC
jgi:hypothetical protein